MARASYHNQLEKLLVPLREVPTTRHNDHVFSSRDFLKCGEVRIAVKTRKDSKILADGVLAKLLSDDPPRSVMKIPTIIQGKRLGVVGAYITKMSYKTKSFWFFSVTPHSDYHGVLALCS